MLKKRWNGNMARLLSKGEHTTLQLIDNPTRIVSKTATGEGAEKLVKEISFLELNKSQFQYSFLPDIFSYEVTEQYARYYMPYLPGPLLRDYIYSESDLSLCNQALNDVIVDLNLLHHEHGIVKSTEFSKDFYIKRLQKRWEKLNDTSIKNGFKKVYSTQNVSSPDVRSIFSLIAQGTTLFIDGKSIDFSLEHLIASFSKLNGVFEVPQTSIRLIHGDPHAGNILLHNKKAVFLDPNGFLDGGDIAYDFGKLLVSFDWHDLSIIGMLEPTKIKIISKGIEVINNKVYRDSGIENRHKALRKNILKLLDEKVTPLYRENDPMLLQRIKLLLYVHQFSFAPTLIKEKPQTALHILLNAISDYSAFIKEGRFNF